MKVSKPSDLFINMIKSLHCEETQLEEALPRLAKQALNKELAKAMEVHAKVTKKHRERLEEIARMLNFTPTGKKCIAMQGIIEELERNMKEIQQRELLDPELIVASQKVEHYEIASYGSACAIAKLMGNDKVLNLLLETLDEEKEQDKMLTELAEKSVNEKAMTMQS